MLISKIRLSSFRNFENKLIAFPPKVGVIIGPNASGKTNIIEAVYLLATGKSFRARIEEEMISYDKEIARVEGLLTVGGGGEKTKLEVVLTRGVIKTGESPEKIEKVARKRLLVNRAGKRLIDFAGIFKVVLFSPQDLELVTESPSVRRNFLNSVLSQVDREYRRASLSYEKGLRQRNKLLLRIREEGLPRGQLLFWNRLLIKNGDYISQKRAELVDFINLTKDFNSQDYEVKYDKSSISEARLDQYKEEEVAAATTLVGPHRDDFSIKLAHGRRKKRDLARYGSRGEQRMGVLWLKLAELSFVKEVTGTNPILLLDDIFSELDHEHREIVMQFVRGQQTIITTADHHFVEDFKHQKLIKLSDKK